MDPSKLYTGDFKDLKVSGRPRRSVRDMSFLERLLLGLDTIVNPPDVGPDDWRDLSVQDSKRRMKNGRN